MTKIFTWIVLILTTFMCGLGARFIWTYEDFKKEFRESETAQKRLWDLQNIINKNNYDNVMALTNMKRKR